MKEFILITAFGCLLALRPAFGNDCGKPTSLHPSSASEAVTQNAGMIRSLSGRVFLPNGEKAENVIVEIYRNNLASDVDKVTHLQINEIIKNGRLAARDTDTKNQFCFEGFPAGNYLLLINIPGNSSQYTTMQVFVTLPTKAKKVVGKELEIRFNLAI